MWIATPLPSTVRYNTLVHFENGDKIAILRKTTEDDGRYRLSPL